MAQYMELSGIIYQEKWQSGWTANGLITGYQIGGPGGLKVGGTYVQRLLTVIVLQDKIVLRPMFLIHRLLPNFFNYEIKFGSIVRCDIYKKEGIVLEFRSQTGANHIIQFTAKDPNKIKQLCERQI